MSKFQTALPWQQTAFGLCTGVVAAMIFCLLAARSLKGQKCLAPPDAVDKTIKKLEEFICS